MHQISTEFKNEYLVQVQHTEGSINFRNPRFQHQVEKIVLFILPYFVFVNVKY